MVTTQGASRTSGLIELTYRDGRVVRLRGLVVQSRIQTEPLPTGGRALVELEGLEVDERAVDERAADGLTEQQVFEWIGQQIGGAPSPGDRAAELADALLAAVSASINAAEPQPGDADEPENPPAGTAANVRSIVTSDGVQMQVRVPGGRWSDYSLSVNSGAITSFADAVESANKTLGTAVEQLAPAEGGRIVRHYPGVEAGFSKRGRKK